MKKLKSKDAEQFFIKTFNAIKSNPITDMEKHIDCYLKLQNKIYSIDVKGKRKGARIDTLAQFIFTWLEIKNVRGNRGSLAGAADFLAFQQIDHFLIVHREPLFRAVMDLVLKRDPTIYRYIKEYYDLYQRPGRLDVITKVPFTFIDQFTFLKLYP